MGNSIKSNTTFWTEISEYRIHVPYYQRDYAQGRIDGGRIDNIRKVFVEELYRAINVTDKGKEKRTCHLGLVFGSYDDAKTTFIAVDGQQRLTTVFLFYWYVAWREGKLSDFKVLSTNFSWSTRSYSSQFVDLLFKINPANNVIEAIKSSSDYFSIWENDPTVKGMLTMLEEIESHYPINESNLCHNLFSNNCNIRYDILKLEKGSDTKTYLKMNSRGRSLTTFELFKSKFIDYYKPSFAKQFDEEWLTFMLEMSRDKTGDFVEPDISYMNLINEYTYLMLKSNDIGNSKRYEDFIAAKVKDNDNLMDIPFISFERYKKAFDGNLERFEKFFNWIIANYATIDRIDAELRFSGSKFFLKEIIKSNNPNYSDRTKLYSIFKYSQLINYANVEEKLFKKWNRVFRNLVENTDIDSSNFGNICKAIDRINTKDIYSYLISDSDKLTYFDNGQVKEEKAKAEHIDNKLWEDVIITAEKFAFFKGSIRFLYQDAEGKVKWDDFDTKLVNVRAFFNEKSQVQRSTLERYINYLNDDDILYLGIKYRFSNKPSIWKSILLDQKLRKATHTFLMNQTGVINNSELKQQLLLVLNNISEDVWILQDWKTNKNVLTNYAVRRDNPNNGYVYPIGTQRHKIIRLLRDNGINVEIPDNSRGDEFYTNGLSSVDCYRGLYATIYYNNCPIRYEGDDKLFLMEKNNPDEYLRDDSTGEKLCCSITSNSDIETIINQMCDLINKANDVNQ